MGSNAPPSLKEARADIAAVHKYLKLGFTPQGIHPKERGSLGAIAAAALERKIPIQTLCNRLAAGGPHERLYGLRVDWSLWQPPRDEEQDIQGEPIAHAVCSVLSKTTLPKEE